MRKLFFESKWRRSPFVGFVLVMLLAVLPIAGFAPGQAHAQPGAWTAYVANHDDNTVTPTNTATDTAGAPIPVGDRPFDIAITPDGATA